MTLARGVHCFVTEGPRAHARAATTVSIKDPDDDTQLFYALTWNRELLKVHTSTRG